MINVSTVRDLIAFNVDIQDVTITNMKQFYEGIVGVIPQYSRPSANGPAKDPIYSGLLIIHKNVETVTRNMHSQVFLQHLSQT